MSKLYSVQEISQHNEEKDLWMVIHGGVYDLTKFLKEHPGGEEVLINLAGQDGSKCFDDIGHSFEAITLRESFKIGEITEMPIEILETNKTLPFETSIDDDDWEYDKQKPDPTPYIPIFLGLSVLVYAIIFYRLWL